MSVEDFDTSDENIRTELISTLLTFNSVELIKDELKKKTSSIKYSKVSQPANDLMWI